MGMRDIDEKLSKISSSDIKLIILMQSKFKRLTTLAAAKLIELLVHEKEKISMVHDVTDDCDAFCKSNKDKITHDHYLKPEVIKMLRKTFHNTIKKKYQYHYDNLLSIPDGKYMEERSHHKMHIYVDGYLLEGITYDSNTRGIEHGVIVHDILKNHYLKMFRDKISEMEKNEI